MSRKRLMVGLIRDTCPVFKRDQRIRPKKNLLCVLCVLERSGREILIHSLIRITQLGPYRFAGRLMGLIRDSTRHPLSPS